MRRRIGVAPLLHLSRGSVSVTSGPRQ
jgi:hypothetical protein